VIQTAVTNLLLRSEEFENAAWSKFGAGGAALPVVTADQSAAPNGNVVADKVVLPAVSGVSARSLLYQALSLPASTTYSISCYLKGDVGGEKVWVGQTNNTVWSSVQCNLTTSWQRFSFVFTTSTAGTHYLTIGVDRLDGSQTATAAQTFFAWGAQLQQAFTVGEYIPTAATINSAPRFDHNPTTGESLGLLVEEQRTNLLVRSEEFDNASWTKTGATVTANTDVAPDGTTTADALVATSGVTSAHSAMGTFIGSAASLTFAASFFVKAGTNSNCGIELKQRTAANVYIGRTNIYFDLSTGAYVNSTTDGTAPTSVTYAITSVGNSWYRIQVIGTTSATAGYVQSTILVGPSENWAGDGTTILVWGAQLEAGAFPTSYIPTTTAAVTRSADVASITGSAFSGFYNQSEGTVFAQANSPVASSVFAIDDGTASNRIIASFLNTTTSPSLRIVSSGADQANFSAGTITANAVFKQASAYKVDDFAATVNGGTVQVDTSGTVPTGLSTVRIGANVAGVTIVNGPIRRLTYFPTRLSDTTLQNITR
jgi:hypothetical protein